MALGIYAYFYLAPAPLQGVPSLVNDVALHAFGSALLFLSLYVVSRERVRLWIIVAITTGISFCFEYAQGFVRVRIFDVEDLAVNALGVGIGATIIGICSLFGWLDRT